jgi:hypothetical protein
MLSHHNKDRTQDYSDHSTVSRLLWHSRHVKDLRIIFYVSVSIAVLFILLLISMNAIIERKVGSVVDNQKLIAGIVTVECAIIVWIYQTASVRLGTVDLFCSEIATICRVVTVTQTASHLSRLYHDQAPPRPVKLHAPYEHSPVFDSNSKDLEVFLPESIGAVTEFYIYLKAMCDFRRLLDETKIPSSEPEIWRIVIRNVTYMLYLMLESGRNTVKSLVENKARRAQYTAEILLSELVAFRLLLEVYKSAKEEDSDHDARFKRLQLRERTYPEIVDRLLGEIKDSRHRKRNEAWEKADALRPELIDAYENAKDMFGKPKPKSK